MKVRHYFAFTIICFILLAASIGCEPYRPLSFINQLSQPIQADAFEISADDFEFPKYKWSSDISNIIDVGQTKEFLTALKVKRVDPSRRKYAIVAVNKDSELVFSKFYTWDELRDMDWKVTIK